MAGNKNLGMRVKKYKYPFCVIILMFLLHLLQGKRSDWGWADYVQ